MWGRLDVPALPRHPQVSLNRDGAESACKPAVHPRLGDLRTNRGVSQHSFVALGDYKPLAGVLALSTSISLTRRRNRQRSHASASLGLFWRQRALFRVRLWAGPAIFPEPEIATPRGPAVVWFRTGDLRVRDHPGLRSAAAAPGGAVCCYVFDLREVARLSPRRLKLLRTAVEGLRRSLHELCGGVSLRIAIAEQAAVEVHALCKAYKASDVYVQDDPTDIGVQGVAELRELLSSDSNTARVCTWRAPLRSCAGEIGSATAYDVYTSAVAGVSVEAPANMAQMLITPPSSKSEISLSKETGAVPSVETLLCVVREDATIAKKVALRDASSYVRGLGAEGADENDALSLLNMFVESGPHSVAESLWGPPSGGDESALAALGRGVPKSKEEWAFRRVANTSEGYKALIPGEVFSRGFSELMLWLGCISLRTAAEHVRSMDAGEEREAALRSIEANEWHRLLALKDLARHAQMQGGATAQDVEDCSYPQVRFWRWRGYLLRYLVYEPQSSESMGIPPFIGVHGFAASCTQFLPLGQELAVKVQGWPGARLFALDMLGFGHSEKPPISFSQYVWEQCVKDFMLAVVGEPAILMGNSIGGYVSTAAAAYVGPQLCRGLVLLNSAGPLTRPDEYASALKENGTVLSRMRQGFGAQAGLPDYSPLPQWLIDSIASILFGLLQPQIKPILRSLYPSNDEPTAQLAEDILRDSKDPFATNVIASFSRLGPSRSSNELLDEYSLGGAGRLLVCQGMADRLGGGPGNQPNRLKLFTGACPALRGQGARLEDCGHCPHHESPAAVAAALQAWTKQEIMPLAE